MDRYSKRKSGNITAVFTLSMILIAMVALLTVNILKLRISTNEVRFSRPWYQEFLGKGSKTEIAQRSSSEFVRISS